MSWLKRVFSTQSSQETKVYYKKGSQTDKTEEDKEKTESEITESKFEEINIDDNESQSTQSSQDMWWSSWSDLSQPFTLKGEKQNFGSLDEEKKEEN